MDTIDDSQPASVVIVGGGYGGINLARHLDEVADVVLVERREAFVHNVAALRAAVDPDWAARIFLPYDQLLARGRVVHDRAVSVRPGEVTLAHSGVLAADYVVLATGSTYPFPAKSHADHTATALRDYAAIAQSLTEAGRILLVGAGPVGLEMAGEITSRWPGKQVVIVDALDHILTGAYREELRDELAAQLKQRGVELLLGSPLAADPPVSPGVVAPFTARTVTGTEVRADLWLRCYGVSPVTDYLSGELAAARTPGGLVRVDAQLRVLGQQRVFATGDITAVDEPKMASRAGRHAAVVAANISEMIEGGPGNATYEPSPPVILVPLGPDGGAAQLPGAEEIAGPEQAAQFKGSHLLIGRYRELFGLPAET